MSGRILSIVLLPLLAASVVFAQDDDEELAPGLIAEYTAGDRSVRRIDGDVAFDWQAGSPDVRLPAGPFSARWSGQILLRAEGKYRWHAYLTGEVTVRVKDIVVLQGKVEQPQWITGEETELSFGEYPFAVDYTSAGTGRILLCWSSDQFPLEPVPHHALFHENTEKLSGPIPAASLAVSQHRCARCHGKDDPIPSPSAPSLVYIGAETSREWLLNQIQHGGGERGEMPKFGFSRDEAEAILAALTADAKSVEFPASTVPKEPVAKDVEAGRELLISTGCLACHQWNKQGRTGDFGGPSLDDVAKHRTGKWLELWLSDPAKINPHHRMPVFTLTKDERRQIASALLAPHPTLADSRAEKPSPETLQLGEKLITESRCAACHELPGPKREPLAAPQWADMKLTDDSCWSAESKPMSRRPQFAKLDAAVLRDYLKSVARQPIQLSADLHGAALLVQKGCVNCHDRDGRKGISAIAKDLAAANPKLEGRAPWMIPPQLTAVGDRLPDERLGKAIRGELPKRRLDWLLVRMPKYQHTESEQAALVAHLIGHDRIPPASPASPEYPLNGKHTAEGRELLGGKGFSCVACHPVKDFTPKQVALGTRGSNLFQIGERLRPDYFFRWTRAPLRVMPGVEMPAYQRPHAAIFPGDLNRQLAAIWTALNDPDLPTPVNPGAVEQYWTVGLNERPRILRDVVTLPGKKEVTIPRAFAVGFSNGHNILFDLDQASIRAWTVGDFAQQRTQGKSWFWDLVGTPVMVNAEGTSDWLIMSTDGKTTLFPSDQADIRLVDYRLDHESRIVQSIYTIHVQPNAYFHIAETWGEAPEGWMRIISLDASARPNKAQVYLLEQEASNREMTIRYTKADGPKWKKLPGSNRRGTQLSAGESVILVLEDPRKIVSTAPVLSSVPLSSTDEVKVVPGFRGQRLPYPTNIMPTAITFNHAGRMLFTSLKGHVYSADDQEAKLFAEGLAAPFGILDSHDMVLVAHKPEIIGLIDTDKDARADKATVIATGWGLTDDYHDWTCGLVRDAEGNLFTTLGSDYAQKDRPKEKSRWRGDALKIDPSGKIESLARGLRFPTGVAMTSKQDVFITDQQGVQNTFNELNWLQPGARFGLPSLHEPEKDAPATPPAVQIPHPWTRSVNGIVAIPKSLADRTHPKLFDQLLGCEYDTRFLIRMSWQLVNGVMQGAAYPLCKPSLPGDPNGLLGPLSIAVSPDGDVYVGSIHDSGWQGGLNTGDIVKLTPSGQWPNGLCEIRATPAGFDLEFFHPVDKSRAADKSRYQISGYTRVWQGSYATPDSNRHNVEIDSITLNETGTVASLKLTGLKPGHVYDVSLGEIGTENDRTLWPNVGFYTLHKLPK